MKRYFLDTPYGQIHYMRGGVEGGTPVILLHKTPRSIDEYAEVIPFLEPKYNVIAVDMLGYGDSDKPEKQPALPDYANVVRLLMDSLNIQKSNLVGHLTGSIISIEVAASWPERIGKLVLSGPIYIDAETRKRHADTPALQQWHVKDDGSHLMELWDSRAQWIPTTSLVNRLVVDVLKAGETSEYAHYAIEEYHMEDRLPLVKAPALLIVGMKDPFVYPQKHLIFKEILAECEIAYLEDVGLFVPDEAPDRFAKLVSDYLG